MTAVGLVTLAGHAALLIFFCRRPTATTVHNIWAWMFLLFCAVTASYSIGANENVHFFIYGVPAAVATVAIARQLRLTPLSVTFVTLFVLNVIGNWLGLDKFKIATVDVLDVFVWTQMALLFRIAWLNPASSQLRTAHQPQKETMFRVIDGRLRNPSKAQT